MEKYGDYVIQVLKISNRPVRCKLKVAMCNIQLTLKHSAH